MPPRWSGAASITCRCRPALLAQVDSSVGGKTAIDSRHGKNLIGAFHQPILVVADTALLDTLPPREFRAGYAEVAKYGLIGDAGFFAWLEANWQEVFAGGPAREHAIAVSCRAKAVTVARDERETGERALLNLGHTFGHAFEAAAGFSGRLLHGEAISLGMALRVRVLGAARAAARRPTPTRVERHLAAVGLPTRPARRSPAACPDAERLMELIAQDKKVKRGKLTFILARGIGARFHRARRRCRRGPRFSRRKTCRAMTTYDWLALAVVFVCLLLSAFFAASETALTASSRARMHRLEKHGSRRAAIVNRLLRRARTADRRAAVRQQRRQHRRLLARHRRAARTGSAMSAWSTRPS